MFKNPNLRGQLLLAILPLIIGTCLVLAFLSLRTARQEMVAQVGQSLQQVAGQGGQLIEARRLGVLQNLEGVANRHVIRSMDWTVQEPALEAEIERMGVMGMGIVTPDRQAQYPGGNTADLTNRGYVEAAFKGNSNMSNVIISRVTNSAVLMAAAPIRDEQGAVRAVLIARLSGDFLSDVTRNIRFGRAGFTWIIDTTGNLVSHDNADLVMDQANFIKQSEKDESLVPLAGVMRRMIAGETGVGRYFFLGGQRVIGFTPIGDTGWFIASGAEEAELMEGIRAMTWVIVGISGVLVLIAAGVMWWIAGRMVKPIAQMELMLKDVSEGDGDLTKRLDLARNDEIGRMAEWFNIFIGKVHDIIAAVRGVSEEIASASNEIAASSEQISRGMGDQSAQITQISAAIEEMSQSVNEVSGKAQNAAGNANEAGREADDGGRIVQDTITGMRSIESTVDTCAVRVQELGQMSEQIGKVVEVINDIADQTNLLALNAAIEAARAGEQGRGFAVVADEVRKLADPTTKATEEVSQSIREIQTGTQTAVQQMENGKSEVRSGVEKAETAGQSLSRIVDGTREVASLIMSIAAATEEQSAASEEVARSVESIASLTRETTEATSQAAQASVQMAQKADQLQAMIERFKLRADDRRKSDQGPKPGHREQRIRMDQTVENLAESTQRIATRT